MVFITLCELQNFHFLLGKNWISFANVASLAQVFWWEILADTSKAGTYVGTLVCKVYLERVAYTQQNLYNFSGCQN